MIRGTKAMIAGCIDRMSRSACRDCERRDACASLFANLFGPKARPRPAARPQARPGQRHPFLALLSQVARAIEDGSMARQDGNGEKEGGGKARDSGFRREVERHVEPMLPLGAVRMEKVARALGCSRQTLYRRLKIEGITFEQLLDGLRRRLALRFMREPGLSVKETSYRLGFSEPAAFSRAFKRWTGRAPRAASRHHSGRVGAAARHHSG
jgi:AraC-like DNA-binding protein